MNNLSGSLTILLLILCSAAFAASAIPPCATMLQAMNPCNSYLTFAAASPTGECCNGVQNMATYIVTQKDRTDVCECLKPAAAAMSDPSRMPTLPALCGANITLPPVTADTNCTTV